MVAKQVCPLQASISFVICGTCSMVFLLICVATVSRHFLNLLVFCIFACASLSCSALSALGHGLMACDTSKIRTLSVLSFSVCLCSFSVFFVFSLSHSDIWSHFDPCHLSICLFVCPVFPSQALRLPWLPVRLDCKALWESVCVYVGQCLGLWPVSTLHLIGRVIQLKDFRSHDKLSQLDAMLIYLYLYDVKWVFLRSYPANNFCLRS